MILDKMSDMEILKSMGERGSSWLYGKTMPK